MDPVLAAVVAALPVAVGLLVVRAQSRIGWLLVAQGVSFWLVFGATGRIGGSAGLVVDQLGAGTWVLPFLWIVLIAYLLPDGHAASPRWAWWLRVTLVGVVLLLVGSAGDTQGFRDAHRGTDPPLRWLPETLSGLLGVLGLLLTVLFVFGGVVAVGWRLRRAEGDDRLRLLWLVWGSLSVPLALLGAWAAHFLLHDDVVVADLALSFAAVGLPVTIGIAVLRHRLFDIQLVLSRTLTFAALSVVVTGVYVGLLRVTDQLFGDGTLGGIAGVVVVAVIAAPLHGWIRRRTERWVYGYRSDPAAALRRLGANVESADPLHVVDTITDSIADALKVDRVWVEPPGTPPSGDPRTVRVPLVHRNERIGDLVVEVPAGRRLSAADTALLHDLARQAAVTVRVSELATELQASRSRIVTAREEERRRLRRDLHDGVGPSLAAIVLKLDAAQSRRDEVERNELLGEIREETRSTIAEVRRLVDDLRPPAIDEVGLVSAIRQRAAALSTEDLHIRVDGPDRLPPLPAAVEVAAFRIVSEAMTNVTKHSDASSCTVEIAFDDTLGLTVTDNGRGTAHTTRTGVGWTSMTERAAELGGSCTITSRADRGLEVRALLPLLQDVDAEVTRP
jgi:two-component system, NarL family, sensor kinase